MQRHAKFLAIELIPKLSLGNELLRYLTCMPTVPFKTWKIEKLKEAAINGLTIEHTFIAANEMTGIAQIYESEKGKIKKMISKMNYQMLFEDSFVNTHYTDNIFRILSEENRLSSSGQIIDVKTELLRNFRWLTSFSYWRHSTDSWRATRWFCILTSDFMILFQSFLNSSPVAQVA